MTNELDLSQFIGTENYHRLGLSPRFLCTDGVAYLADKAKCYWLVDLISAYALTSGTLESFLTIDVTTSHSGSGKVRITDGNDNALHTVQLDYTDFPFDTFRLFCQFDGIRWVLMLPSEY